MRRRSLPGAQSMPWTLRWPLVKTSGRDAVGAEVGGAQDLAVEAVGLGERGVADLAGRDVEPVVGAEREPAAVVDRPGLDALHDHAVLGQAVIGEAIARDLVAVAGRAVEVDEAVVAELRVDRDPEQAALRAVGLDDVDLADRLVAQLARGREQAHATGALGHQRTAVGEPRDRPRRVETAGHGADAGALRGGLVIAPAAAGEREQAEEGGAAHVSSVPGHGPRLGGARLPLVRARRRARLAAVRPAVRADRRAAGSARARGRVARRHADGLPRRGPRRSAARSRPRAGGVLPHDGRRRARARPRRGVQRVLRRPRRAARGHARHPAHADERGRALRLPAPRLRGGRRAGGRSR